MSGGGWIQLYCWFMICQKNKREWEEVWSSCGEAHSLHVWMLLPFSDCHVSSHQNDISCLCLCWCFPHYYLLTFSFLPVWLRPPPVLHLHLIHSVLFNLSFRPVPACRLAWSGPALFPHAASLSLPVVDLLFRVSVWTPALCQLWLFQSSESGLWVQPEKIMIKIKLG